MVSLWTTIRALFFERDEARERRRRRTHREDDVIRARESLFREETQGATRGIVTQARLHGEERCEGRRRDADAAILPGSASGRGVEKWR